MVAVFHQVAGGIVEAILTASLAAALADFRVGLPGIVLQILGGYAVLRLLARGGNR